MEAVTTMIKQVWVSDKLKQAKTNEFWRVKTINKIHEKHLFFKNIHDP